MKDKFEYNKQLYKVIYFDESAKYAGRNGLPRKTFIGTIDNFYPSGKCVFYSEKNNNILAIDYDYIAAIIPIDEEKLNN